MNTAAPFLIAALIALAIAILVDSFRRTRRAIRDTFRDWRIFRESSALISAALRDELIGAHRADYATDAHAASGFNTEGVGLWQTVPSVPMEALSGLMQQCMRRVKRHPLHLHSPVWLESAREHARHRDAARRRLQNRVLAGILGLILLPMAWLFLVPVLRPLLLALLLN